MLLNRRGVEENHLDKYSVYLFKVWSCGESELVAYGPDSIQFHKVYVKKDKIWIYFAIDKLLEASLGYICLHTIPRWKALETTNLFVPKCHRGKGIALMLYDAVMKDGKIVMSGWSHTLKSRGLWMKLVQDDRYISWAHDVLNLKRFAPVLIDDNKYVCEFKLYRDIKNHRKKKREDIRLVIYNPKYTT